jgi:hypothetical protein
LPCIETIIRVQGEGLIAKRVKSKASKRGLIMPAWWFEMFRKRRVRRGGFDGPVFPDSLGGLRDRSNVHRKTVATLLDRRVRALP